jgi:hypothetical protein
MISEILSLQLSALATFLIIMINLNSKRLRKINHNPFRLNQLQALCAWLKQRLVPTVSLSDINACCSFSFVGGGGVRLSIAS